MLFVDSPFEPTAFVATGVQLDRGCATLVPESSTHDWFVPPTQTILRLAPDCPTLPRVAGGGGST